MRTTYGRLHYLECAGRGGLPTIVLLHGLGSAAVHLGEVIIRLRRAHRRVIAIDGLGHGYSPYPEGGITPEAYYGAQVEAIGQLTRDPVLLMGNSLGGAVALRAAADHPALIRGLVLMSPAGAATTEAELRAHLDELAIDTPARARDFLGRVYHRRPWYTRSLARDLVQRFASPAVIDLRNTSSTAHQLTPEEAGRLRMPTLVIWGASDRVVPRRQLEWFRQHLPPTARFEETPKWGHSPYLEAPGPVCRRLIAFAEEVASHRPPLLSAEAQP